MPGTERRNSSASEDSSVTPSKQDGGELIPTRTNKAGAPKPAANPLQFIKVGPCDLYKAAQEQIRKVEQIKKVEKVKDDSEDWQSNLDNWKCSRRKRQEHIIERVVEVKKIELEEHERNRRRGKTLNEMMEERTQKGVGPRKMSLLSYPDEDANDLSDLGIGLSDKDSTDTSLSRNEDENENNQDNRTHTNGNGTSETQKSGSNGHGSSPEPEEYTYERAIQGYKTFAEKKVKAGSRQRVSPPKKETGARIGEKLQELEQVRLRSNSVNDINLPKVDIHKRRSLFEMVESAETKSPSAERVAKDLGGSNIVKERLSSLERVVDPVLKTSPRPLEEVSVTIKDRLSNLEKQKSSEARRTSTEEVAHISIKERLSSLEKHQKGMADFVNSNSGSDEEIGQKDMLSPAVSDREVSSPLVSSNTEIEVEGKVEVALEVGITAEKEKTSFSVEGSKIDESSSGVVVDKEKEKDVANSSYLKPNSTDVPSENEAEDIDCEISETIEEDAKTEDVIIVEEETKIEITSNITNAPGIGNETLHELIDKMEEVSESTEIENKQPENFEKAPDITEEAKDPVDGGSKITVEKTVIVTDNQDEISVSETIIEEEKPQSSTVTPSKVSVTKTRKTIIKKPKPKLRARKLTPILTAPKPVLLSPVKTPGDLAVISEDRPLTPKIAEDGLIAILEDGAHEAPVPAPRITGKGAETSESGIDMEDSLYTDENIDEVLGEDDVEYVSSPAEPESIDLQTEAAPFPNDSEAKSEMIRQQEAVTRFDELFSSKVEEKSIVPAIEESVIKSEIEVQYKENDLLINLDEDVAPKPEIKNSAPNETPAIEMPKQTMKENFEVEEAAPHDLLILDTKTASQEPALYENIIITNQFQVTPLGLPGEILSFPLSPSSSVQPPKEKPPPPPVDISDEETPELPPKTSLRRLDSTKRIKKEIRKKRSDFLGIEGTNDDSYLEPEVNIAPPPDMLTILQEERKLDQQLYRQSISSEADSAEGSEVRSSAVDRLDKALFMDKGLFRQSICSESDSNHETAESRDSGVELDRGHVDDLCWTKQSPSPDVSSEPHSRQNSEPYGNVSVTSEEDEIMKKEREIIEVLEKEEEWRYGNKLSGPDQAAIGEKLAKKLMQLEEEKMQLEWERADEEDRRLAGEERLQAKEVQLRQQENSSNINKTTAPSQENLRTEREHLEKEQLELARVRQQLEEQQKQMSKASRQGPMASNLRYSMPNLQDDQKPVAVSNNRPPAMWARVPSADNLLAPQQMTRSTLQALSAAPRSRIVNCEAWMQPKRKTDGPKNAYNYQHWLIQEAEHRRITEQQQRINHSRRSLPNQLRSPTHYSPAQGSPVLVNGSQGSPHRQQPPASSHYPIPGHTTQPHHSHGRSGHPPLHNGVHYPPQSSSVAVSQPHSHSHNLPHTISSPSHHTVGLPPSSHVSHPHPPPGSKPLPESVIQTLTQRVQNKVSPKRRVDERLSNGKPSTPDASHFNGEQERMLSVSGKKKCSHCGDELGRGAAMVIESLRLFYHIDCFKCCVCHTQLGDGLMGTDVRVRNNKLHCHNCYSSDDGENNCKTAVIFKETSDESNDEEESNTDSGLSCCDDCCCYNYGPALELIAQQYLQDADEKLTEMRQICMSLVEMEIRNNQILEAILTTLNKFSNSLE